MPIYHYPGYLFREEAAIQYKVKRRTINDWIRKVSKPPDNFFYLKVDGYICVKDPYNLAVPPQGISLGDLESVRNFSTRNNLFYERVYLAIITGELNGVVFCGIAFIIKTDPQTITYLRSYKRKKNL